MWYEVRDFHSWPPVPRWGNFDLKLLIKLLELKCAILRLRSGQAAMYGHQNYRTMKLAWQQEYNSSTTVGYTISNLYLKN